MGELIDLLADLTPVALVPDVGGGDGGHECDQDRVEGGAGQAWNTRPRRHSSPAHHTAPIPIAAQPGHAEPDADPIGDDLGDEDQQPEAALRYPLAVRVGMLLRRERLARDRNLASLARALQVSTPHVCKVELARTEVKLSFLAWWCAELGVRLSEVLRMAEDGPSAAASGLVAPAVSAPAAPGKLAVPAWTVPLYRSGPARFRPARTGARCAHSEIQTRVERRAGRPADITRCVACGQPVPIRTTTNPATTRLPERCPLAPNVVVLDEGVIAL